MDAKYKKVGLNYDLILTKFPDIEEYEKTIRFYFEDENFKLLGEYLEDEDYAMAKDACKGLYILASELMLFPIYEELLEVYEDLEAEMYKEVIGHYNQMINVYKKVKGVFYA